MAVFLMVCLPGAFVELDDESLAALTPWRVLRVRRLAAAQLHSGWAGTGSLSDPPWRKSRPGLVLNTTSEARDGSLRDVMCVQNTLRCTNVGLSLERRHFSSGYDSHLKSLSVFRCSCDRFCRVSCVQVVTAGVFHNTLLCGACWLLAAALPLLLSPAYATGQGAVVR